MPRTRDPLHTGCAERYKIRLGLFGGTTADQDARRTHCLCSWFSSGSASLRLRRPRNRNVNPLRIESAIATSYLPKATAAPTTPVFQTRAAVAAPEMVVPSFSIAPPPMNPMPAMSPCNTRVNASELGPDLLIRRYPQ